MTLNCCILSEKVDESKKNNKAPALSFKIEKDGDGFHVWCPELSGCHSHGVSIEQAIINLKDAINLYLEDL